MYCEVLFSFRDLVICKILALKVNLGMIFCNSYCRNQSVYPVVVAAHPAEPNQFAVGLTDGSVKVIEPSESEGKWGSSPPIDNGIVNGRTASSSTTSNHTPDQAQR